jgi:putative PEP-CTERM system histidine kinase
MDYAVTASDFGIVATWSYGLAAACYTAFAIRLAFGWRRSARATLLIAATVATALWSASTVADVLGSMPFAWLAANAFDMLRYAAWFTFAAYLLKGRTTDVPGAAVASPPIARWVIAVVVAGLVSSLLLSAGYIPRQMSEAQGRTSEYALRLGLAIFGLVLVEQLLRRALPHARWGLKPLCVGLAGVFGFDIFLFAEAMLFGQLDSNIFVARGIANVLVIPFIAIATARNTGWTLELHMSRGVVFQTTAILVSGIFILAVAAAGYFVRYVGGGWGVALQIELLFAALLLGMMVVSSGRFRSKLRVFISKHFFSYRYDYRQEWLRFTRTLSAESSVQKVQERCIEALANLVESPSGALWLRRESGNFRPTSRWNMPLIDAAAVEPASGSLVQFLQRTGWVINLREYQSAPERYAELTLPAWLGTIREAWLVVPLVSGTELVGFVVLATPRTAVDVNWEVLDLLKTASRQAASYLGQIEATEALLEARKFDAFNRMSAFVVHDLKNLVAQLSLMLRNAERHKDNPEFQRDMLATVEHVVGRMNQLMLQLRIGTTPLEKPRLTDLEHVVRKVHSAKAATGARIDTELVPGVSTIGHEERLEHVIGHLVQNALDATAKGGAVSVRLFHDKGFATIEVSDTGVGMSPEFVRDRLFKPFETTKAAGMGIGVYESWQYVSGLGGQMLIDSTPGVGTRVRVLLPLAEGQAAPAAPDRVQP